MRLAAAELHHLLLRRHNSLAHRRQRRAQAHCAEHGRSVVARGVARLPQVQPHSVRVELREHLTRQHSTTEKSHGSTQSSNDREGTTNPELAQAQRSRGGDERLPLGVHRGQGLRRLLALRRAVAVRAAAAQRVARGLDRQRNAVQLAQTCTCMRPPRADSDTTTSAPRRSSKHKREPNDQCTLQLTVPEGAGARDELGGLLGVVFGHGGALAQQLEAARQRLLHVGQHALPLRARRRALRGKQTRQLTAVRGTAHTRTRMESAYTQMRNASKARDKQRQGGSTADRKRRLAACCDSAAASTSRIFSSTSAPNDLGNRDTNTDSCSKHRDENFRNRAL